jgi:peptidoglycan/xylan/chitin deacetylase (PgdA/CDA1 family)
MPIPRRRLLAGTAAATLVAGGQLPFGSGNWLPAVYAATTDVPDDFIGYVDVPRFFPETRHNVDGAILAYFRANGGVEALGFPLTEEFWEPGGQPDDPDDPEQPILLGRMVQYFQRACLEFDPQTKAVRRSPLGELLDRAQPAAAPLPGGRYFPETGHNLGQAFLAYFQQSGGLATLGYPISEEVEENGRAAQWFQQTRLEWWPENPPGSKVQPGLVGVEHLEAVGDEVPPAVLRPAMPLAPLREWRLPPVPAPVARRVPALAVPILYYHQVASQGQLRAQIQAFRAAGRTIVPLTQVVDAVRGEGLLPAGAMALTFDDGWGTQYSNALPVLQAERAPATFFVITRFLGTIAGYMSWEQVRTIKELGHDVESHTQNHPSLDLLRAQNEAAAVAEVWESLAILEARLGRTRRLLAYPNGRWDTAVATLAARVYRGAVATGGGTLQSQDRLYAMRRIKAEPSYDPESLLQQMGQ